MPRFSKNRLSKNRVSKKRRRYKKRATRRLKGGEELDKEGELKPKRIKALLIDLATQQKRGTGSWVNTPPAKLNNIANIVQLLNDKRIKMLENVGMAAKQATSLTATAQSVKGVESNKKGKSASSSSKRAAALNQLKEFARQIQGKEEMVLTNSEMGQYVSPVEHDVNVDFIQATFAHLMDSAAKAAPIANPTAVVAKVGAMRSTR